MNDAKIDDRFFNHSPATVAAIREYHRTHDAALVQPIFNGIMDKYLPDEIRAANVAHAAGIGDNHLTNAFGLESLTLLEVVVDLQDALDIDIHDADLRRMHDLKDAHALLVEKVSALRQPDSVPSGS